MPRLLAAGASLGVSKQERDFLIWAAKNHLMAPSVPSWPGDIFNILNPRVTPLCYFDSSVSHYWLCRRLSGKESTCGCWRQETWVQSLGQEDHLDQEMQPTPVFLPGKSHGQRSLATVHGGVTKSPKCLSTDARMRTHTHTHIHTSTKCLMMLGLYWLPETSHILPFFLCVELFPICIYWKCFILIYTRGFNHDSHNHKMNTCERICLTR